MKVLITGHRGFIGGALWRELASHGYGLCGHDLREGDLTKPIVFSDHLETCQPDLVVHLAAQVGRLFGERDLAHTISSNVTMTALIARACGERGIPVLYASSSEVYGDQGESVCHEDGPLELPHNAYGLSKRQGEEFLQLYAACAMVARLSMPAGPGAPPGRGRRALDTFLWQAIHGKLITVHEGAERSWCHVADTVAGLRMIIEHGIVPGAWNVGRDDCPVSMLELARKCCDLVGASHDLIQVVPAPERQTIVKRLSTTKLQLLGWEPTKDLPQILADTYHWVKHFDAEGNKVERVT